MLAENSNAIRKESIKQDQTEKEQRKNTNNNDESNPSHSIY